MENSSQNPFSFNYKQMLIDEIALDGLEGIGLDMLWKRLEKRISSPVTEKMKARFWNTVVNCKDVSFYNLPKPAHCTEILDRFTIIDEETGHLADSVVCLDGPYEYHPVDSDHGSCANYEKRILISKENIKEMSYGEVVTEYDAHIVMVASIEARWQALAPHVSITHLNSMTAVHYCILELIGKARENGQMTVGNTNLTKIMKDSKLLFYNRNYLQKLDLIRAQCVTQVTANRGIKGLLLRLKRFHQPLLLSMPKVGKLHNILDYLLKMPNYCERTEVMTKSGLMCSAQSKRLAKTSNVFHFGETMTMNKNTNKTKQADAPQSPKRPVKRKYVSLKSPSDESSESDEEINEEPLNCQYKVGVNLLRQAYEQFLEAGLKGLTQIEVAQLLGIEFYTSRTICRTLKNRNIVREFLEDKGRQRTSRYIAVTATGDMDDKYEEEQKKFMEYLVDSTTPNDQEQPTASIAESDTEVPKKNRKTENNDMDHENIIVDSKLIEKEVTEIRVLDGLENHTGGFLLDPRKCLTLRQLRFANGLIKVIREKLVVIGYQTLSSMVSKEINEPPMDTKALKLFMQKLVTDGQLKMMKMKWPGPTQKHTVLICAPHLKPTDSVINAKYKEISMRALRNKKSAVKKMVPENISRPLSLFAYPRYMKIQKLHEFLVKSVYFPDEDIEFSDLPPGFSCLTNIIPEITLEFAMGNISHIAMPNTEVKITDDLLTVKLRNTPPEIFRMLLSSVSLQTSIRTNLKVLAMLGLIQLIKEHQSDETTLLSYVFYVNRYAKIINTKGKWPRDDAEILEKLYFFESMQDVAHYWSDVYNVSTTTTIELASRGKRSFTPVVRLQKDVLKYDNGQILGDGLGPCGFDSCFYMEVPRLWSTFSTKLKKKQQLMQNKSRMKMPKKETKKKYKKNSKKTKPVPTPVTAQPKPNMKKCRKKDSNAAIAKWTIEEDRIIMLCKAALTIISPVSQPGCLRLRNYVARDILSLRDPKKTGSACHKRSVFLESNSTLTHEKNSLINELRHREHLMRKYEGLLRKLKIKYSGNLSKLMQEARIPMLELVWILYELARSKSFKRRIPCVAIDIEDFHNNYTICVSTANKPYNLYKTPAECGAHIATIKEAIVLSVMLTYKNELSTHIASKIYSMFDSHPEQTLRTAIEQLRKCGAISAKEKILNNQMHRFHFQDIVHSSYKISAAYQRKWISKLNSEFVEKLGDTLDLEIAQNALKGSPELNCLLSEHRACSDLEIITVTDPVITGSTGSLLQEEQLSVLDMEAKYKLKAGAIAVQNNTEKQKFSELQGDINYEEFSESLTRSAIVKPTDHKECESDERIMIYLKNKKDSASTFHEIQEFTRYDTKTLSDKINDLESKNIVKRVGYHENLILLTEFSQLWTMSVDQNWIMSIPWMMLDGKIRYDIFFKWAGVIMNKVFEYPGCTVSYLSDSCEYLSTRSVQDICVFLEKCKCVTLNVMKTPEFGLFSNDDNLFELEEFNQYESVESILVFPVKNALTTYAFLRKNMLDEYFKENA